MKIENNLNIINNNNNNRNNHLEIINFNIRITTIFNPK